MDKIIGATLVYFLVSVSSVVCDRSDDCKVDQLRELEVVRGVLHSYLENLLGKYRALDESLASSCKIYNEEWKQGIDEIYDNCQHNTQVPGFNYENYTRTVEVFEFVCNSRPEYSAQRDCLGNVRVQYALDQCFTVYNMSYNKMLQKLNAGQSSMSELHDYSCDQLDIAIQCVTNSSKYFCNEAAADYHEKYFRAYISPWMNRWKCQFDRSWGWIITTGILIAVLAFVALLWAAMFLTCRYCFDDDCCSCCGGGGGSGGRRRRRYSDDSDVHPMERY